MQQLRLLRGMFSPFRNTLCENVTPSTKPEIHNVSQRRQKRTAATATGNMHKKNTAKGGRVVSEICTRTDRQTDILITIVRTPSRGEVTSAETKVYTVIVDKGDCDDNDNDDRQYGVKGSKVMEIDAYDDVRDSVTIYYSQKKQRRLD